MADHVELVEAVYVGGDALLRPTEGKAILPGDTVYVTEDQLADDLAPYADRRDLDGPALARLELLARNYQAGLRGDPLEPDPLDPTIVDAPASDADDEDTD